MDFSIFSIFLVLLICVIREQSCLTPQKVDIPAYEYKRRFNTTLRLGDCPDRFIVLNGVTSLETCQLSRRYGETIVTPKPVSYSKVMHIQDPQKLIFHIGLCHWDAVQFFGLLGRNQDCIAAEIAKKLSFGSKSSVRMLVDHFRPRIDSLNVAQEHIIPPDFSHYGWDKYYVSNISVGSREIIVVELLFTSRQMAEKAEAFEQTRLLSEYVREVTRRIGVPRKIKLIRISTADGILHHPVFKGPDTIDIVIKLLQFYEEQIEQSRDDIVYGRKVAHLRYDMQQYETGPIAAPLQAEVNVADLRENWENVTLLEVAANRLYMSYKRFRRLCKGTTNAVPACWRIQDILRDLKAAISCIHDKRSSWSSVTFPGQQVYIKSMKRVLKAMRLKLKVESKVLKKILKRTNG